MKTTIIISALALYCGNAAAFCDIGQDIAAYQQCVQAERAQEEQLQLLRQIREQQERLRQQAEQRAWFPNQPRPFQGW